MPSNLLVQRCLRHPTREAVARCPSCAKYFCRECVTEHNDQVLCNDCFRRDREKAATGKGGEGMAWTLLKFALSFLFLWLVFYSMGRVLLSMPASFHDGTIWREFGQFPNKP